MFGLFKKKELKCDLCTRLLEKEKYHEGEAVFVGENTDSENFFKICPNCFNKKLRSHLQFFSGKAVVVKPFASGSCFHYYTFEELIKYDFHEETVGKAKTLLPTKAGCDRCSNRANYVLYPPEIYDYNPNEMEIVQGIERQHLCPNCVADQLIDTINENQFYFWSIIPPIKGNGILTSFDT